MCVLMGVSLNKNEDLSLYWKNFLPLSAVHRDGWGISITSKQKPFLIKEGRAAYKSDIARYLMNKGTIKGKCGMFHLRFASKGEVANRNAHPFICGEYAFGHNGTIGVKDNGIVLQKAKARGETDSEMAFLYLYEQLQAADPDDEWDIIADVAKKIGFGFNFLLARQNVLYAYWSGYNELHAAKTKHGYIVSTSTIKAIASHWMSFREGQLVRFVNGKIDKAQVLRSDKDLRRID